VKVSPNYPRKWQKRLFHALSVYDRPTPPKGLSEANLILNVVGPGSLNDLIGGSQNESWPVYVSVDVRSYWSLNGQSD
jgi:hypothetical protein